MDAIANMLTMILNAQRVGKQRVAVPYSRFKEQLAGLLKEQGLLSAVRVQEGPRPKLVVTLAYDEAGHPRIRGVQRLSTPGQRYYVSSQEIPFSLIMSGMMIVSTPQGLMVGSQARRAGVGGELVCEVW